MSAMWFHRIHVAVAGASFGVSRLLFEAGQADGFGIWLFVSAVVLFCAGFVEHQP